MHMSVDEPSGRHAYLEAQELAACVAGCLEEGDPLFGDRIFDDSSGVGHGRRFLPVSALNRLQRPAGRVMESSVKRPISGPLKIERPVIVRLYRGRSSHGQPSLRRKVEHRQSQLVLQEGPIGPRGRGLWIEGSVASTQAAGLGGAIPTEMRKANGCMLKSRLRTCAMVKLGGRGSDGRASPRPSSGSWGSRRRVLRIARSRKGYSSPGERLQPIWNMCSKS